MPHSIPFLNGVSRGYLWVTYHWSYQKQATWSKHPPFASNWREGLSGLGLAQGTSCSTWHFLGGWVGNRCLQHPFRLVLKPCQGVGRDGNTAGLGLLDQGHTSNSSHMDVWIVLPFKCRHEAPPRSHVPKPLIRWVIQLVGFIRAFSLPNFSHQSSSVHLHSIFHSSHGLRWTQQIGLLPMYGSS